jgi:hypothetical protein
MENIPRHIDEAPFHTPVLEWWANEYDHVFIVFSPFFRVQGFSPATAAFGPIHIDAAGFQDIKGFIESPVSRPNEAPDNFDQTIKACGEGVSWADVQSAISVTDFMEFARAAWLWTVGSDRIKDHSDTVEKIETYCKTHDLYPPKKTTCHSFWSRLSKAILRLWRLRRWLCITSSGMRNMKFR